MNLLDLGFGNSNGKMPHIPTPLTWILSDSGASGGGLRAPSSTWITNSMVV
jgi:hypothetical protein